MTTICGNISLTSIESGTLMHLTLAERSAFSFWQEKLRFAGIRIPPGKCIHIEQKFGYDPFTEYTWHLVPKALSPKAIADGRAYAQSFERMEQGVFKTKLDAKYNKQERTTNAL